jgi:pimeloyl-ACP methyl ester carboxylesterase
MTTTDIALTQQPGAYVQANGVNIYYERHGVGEPLILLHGGTVTSKMWEPYLPVLSQHFEVITPDSRGHGKTENPAQALSYRAMADDVAAFIQALGLSQPLVGGYSDGGQIALELGMRYPDLAKGLIIGGAFYKFSESYLNWTKDFGIESPGVINIEHIEREMADAVSMWNEWHFPEKPNYWQTLLCQLSMTWLTPLDYTAQEFSQIIVPTFILLGDRDNLVPVEQALEMYRLIPQAEVAILPNATHGFPWSKVELSTQLMLDFLLRQKVTVDQPN